MSAPFITVASVLEVGPRSDCRPAGCRHGREDVSAIAWPRYASSSSSASACVSLDLGGAPADLRSRFEAWLLEGG
jgi:hypothetical protein